MQFWSSRRKLPWSVESILFLSIHKFPLVSGLPDWPPEPDLPGPLVEVGVGPGDGESIGGGGGTW